jgi:hypothetical protein
VRADKRCFNGRTRTLEHVSGEVVFLSDDDSDCYLKYAEDRR